MFEVALVSRAGVDYGTVFDARDIAVTRGIKAPRTARFTIGRSHSMRSIVRQTSRVIGKVYDVSDGGVRTLKFVGPITAHARTAGDDLSVAIGMTDPAWYLARRALIVNSWTTSHPDDYVVQRGHAFKWIIQTLNQDGAIFTDTNFPGYPGPWGLFYMMVAGGAGDTGIRHRTIATTPTITLPSSDPQYASDIIQTLTVGLDGPDWALYPVEPVADGIGRKLADLDVVPVIGTTKPNVIFEYGHGKRNVATYQEIIDPSSAANAVTTVVNGLGLLVTDATSIAGNGPLDAIVDSSGLQSTAFAQQLIDDHLLVRKNPRSIITFTVIVDPDPGNVYPENRRVPRAGIEFDFGDIITFSAVEAIDVREADGTVTAINDELVIPATQMRVYAIEEADDAGGNRTITLTVVA